MWFGSPQGELRGRSAKVLEGIQTPALGDDLVSAEVSREWTRSPLDNTLGFGLTVDELPGKDTGTRSKWM